MKKLIRRHTTATINLERRFNEIVSTEIFPAGECQTLLKERISYLLSPRSLFHSKVNERSETKTSDKLTEINSLKNILLSYNETSTIFFSSENLYQIQRLDLVFIYTVIFCRENFINSITNCWNYIAVRNLEGNKKQYIECIKLYLIWWIIRAIMGLLENQFAQQRLSRMIKRRKGTFNKRTGSPPGETEAKKVTSSTRWMVFSPIFLTEG